MDVVTVLVEFGDNTFARTISITAVTVVFVVVVAFVISILILVNTCLCVDEMKICPPE